MDYREANGRFTNRKQLLKVAKLGPKAFEQCAGFMRITDGDNPLDATSVHPESYEATMKLLDRLDLSMEDAGGIKAYEGRAEAAGRGSCKAQASEAETGSDPQYQHSHGESAGSGHGRSCPSG